MAHRERFAGEGRGSRRGGVRALDDIRDTLAIIEHQGKQILSALRKLSKGTKAMARDMDTALRELEAEMERDTTVSEGLATAFDKLQEQLRQATAGNPQVTQRVDAVLEGFKKNTDRLATKLLANTNEGGGGQGGGDTGGQTGGTGGEQGGGAGGASRGGIPD